MASERHAARTRTIYLFGAGASAAEAESLPTSADLYDQLRAALRDGHPAVATLGELLEGWGPDYLRLPFTEELLALLDGCLVQGEPIGREWELSRLARCREELLTFLYGAIETCSEGALCSENGLYCRLVTGLDPETATLVSLNYDLLLDRALVQSGTRVDYALELANVAPAPPGTTAMRLLKLHGSLNWSYCGACFTTMLVLPAPDRLDTCSRCGGLLGPLIVPPTPLKASPSPFLSALWKKADWELAQARKVVFIGYSLSDADANIRYMLFRAFHGAVPEVEVVLDREVPVVAGRYERLFPGGVRFHWEGFAGYVEEACGSVGPYREFRRR